MIEVAVFGKDFSAPVVAAIEALDSDQRRRILIDLSENGSLSYSEIQKRIEIEKGTLNYHLKKLVAAGLVRNILVSQGALPYSSYYEISDLAKDMVDGLISAFRPPSAQVRITSTTTTTYTTDLTIRDQGRQRIREETSDAANTSTNRSMPLPQEAVNR
jgi:DNA-binding transcriptional ArsR family regulator